MISARSEYIDGLLVPTWWVLQDTAFILDVARAHANLLYDKIPIIFEKWGVAYAEISVGKPWFLFLYVFT